MDAGSGTRPTSAASVPELAKQHTIAIVAEAAITQVAPMCDGQLGHAQERQGDGHLRDHQSVAEDAPGSRLCGTALAQRRRRGGHERGDRRHEAEEERRQHSDGDGEYQHPRIEWNVQTRRRTWRAGTRHHDPHQHRRGESRADDTQDAAERAEEQRFGQHLPYDAEAAGTQRNAYCHLLLARGAAASSRLPMLTHASSSTPPTIVVSSSSGPPNC